eukprot:523571-Alexandrium_andersonii.AAC.1
MVAQIRRRLVYRSAVRPGAAGAARRQRRGWPPRGCCPCSAGVSVRGVAPRGAALVRGLWM